MTSLIFRTAQSKDLSTLVGLLADDVLGAGREDNRLPLNPAYTKAFHAIEVDPNQRLVVVENTEQICVGMLQLSFIPSLTRTGSWRCLIEGVRIQRAFRGQGYGQKMFEWAIEAARERGCKLVQLTSDKQRPEAHRFYERLGFVASHEGFKLPLAKD